MERAVRRLGYGEGTAVIRNVTAVQPHFRSIPCEGPPVWGALFFDERHSFSFDTSYVTRAGLVAVDGNEVYLLWSLSHTADYASI